MKTKMVTRKDGLTAFNFGNYLLARVGYDMESEVGVLVPPMFPMMVIGSRQYDILNISDTRDVDQLAQFNNDLMNLGFTGAAIDSILQAGNDKVEEVMREREEGVDYNG